MRCVVRSTRSLCSQVQDLLVLVPFLILLLIPLSPPGHMLVFSLILKARTIKCRGGRMCFSCCQVYPDFVPSPFTEHRQNASCLKVAQCRDVLKVYSCSGDEDLQCN